jgi:exopolysaccharide biosynthesis protein
MKKFLCILLIFVLLGSAGCTPAPEMPNVEGWTLTNEQTREAPEGITYRERVYHDAEEKPYRVCILELDPKKVTLQTGTSQNGYELMPSKRQTVREHALAAIAEGVNVLAAVNGDYFDIESTYIPTGLSIKNGTMIRDNSRNRPYSAVTREGQYLISRGGIDGINPDTLDMAVGGNYILVWEGEKQEPNLVDATWTTKHPRTLAGVRSDGTILLVVIDGRQPDLSNGATLVECAQLMYSLGAVAAINHDGGGSSTMLIREGADFQVMNSPSDGSERRVFCSIQVVAK